VSLLPSAYLGIQGAKAEATVGLERAHAKLLSQGESLTVMVFRQLDLQGIMLRGDLTEEAEGPYLWRIDYIGRSA
jgi:hypothetical protein